ncbi:MAG: hypothetical protein KAY24_11995 [Candidatus Eisenbacteria sp.]|nr:hypothetical protein [Candidatus Eisenbacteria bacterium]
MILITLIGIAIGMAPTLKQYLGGVSSQQATNLGPTGWVDAPIGTSRQLQDGPQETDASGLAASRPSGQRLADQGSRVPGEAPLDRHVEQAQVIREELARRERSVAVREEVLRRQVLEEFWQRQAAASAATIAVALLLVVLVARRMGDWTGFSKRLQNEESRMRNLQLSVIGALEEFESEVAAARAWAAAEARARRPVGDGALQVGGQEARDPFEAQVSEAAGTNAGERLFPKPVISQVAAVAEQRAVEAMTPGPEPPRGKAGAGGSFEAPAIEESRNQVWADMPRSEEPSPSVGKPLAWEATRKAAESIRDGIASRKEQPDMEPAEHAGISSPARTYPSEDILGPPRPLRREPEQSWHPPSDEGGSSRPGQQSVWQAACQRTQGHLQMVTGSAPHEALEQPAGQVTSDAARENWVRRFLEPETEIAAPGHIDQASEESGPWEDWTARREGHTPPPPGAFQPPQAIETQPAFQASPPSRARPGVREQVEYLASEGFPEREIARRLGLAREEVQLALSLGRGSRVAAVRRGEATAPGNADARAEWDYQEQITDETDR